MEHVSHYLIATNKLESFLLTGVGILGKSFLLLLKAGPY